MDPLSRNKERDGKKISAISFDEELPAIGYRSSPSDAASNMRQSFHQYYKTE